MGGSPVLAQSAVTNAASPEEISKRCAQAVLDWGAADGFTTVDFPQPYDSWSAGIECGRCRVV
jgi:hypothetical protein